MYFVCLLEPLDETINIQMPEEIAKADWIPLDQLQHYKFTSMARNVCRLLTHLEDVKNKKIDLSKMPIGDLFKDTSFTFEDYELLGNKNRFYSPEYINKIGGYIKDHSAKL